jgi:hypothetical protein
LSGWWCGEVLCDCSYLGSKIMGTGYSSDPASRASRFLTYLRQREGMVYPCVGVLFYGEGRGMTGERNKKKAPTRASTGKQLRSLSTLPWALRHHCSTNVSARQTKVARSVGTLPFWETATYLGTGTVGPRHRWNGSPRGVAPHCQR